MVLERAFLEKNATSTSEGSNNLEVAFADTSQDTIDGYLKSRMSNSKKYQLIGLILLVGWILSLYSYTINWYACDDEQSDLF